MSLLIIGYNTMPLDIEMSTNSLNVDLLGVGHTANAHEKIALICSVHIK
jgi:hypothetical protein